MELTFEIIGYQEDAMFDDFDDGALPLPSQRGLHRGRPGLELSAGRARDAQCADTSSA
ncbi:hypothetical protein [Paracoccus salsus]|uniref:hypothetical protein n=1 Tax=Paracoccus salsus TaxID=2911061 RepID=UPI001F27EE7E|nr:hypothetical protein [Paracoccus salsus]MCF3973859.1 hypothetical protein [Paracoccus salsus]